MQMLRNRRFWVFLALAELIVLIIVLWGWIVNRQEVARYEGYYDTTAGNEITTLFAAAKENDKLLERIIAGESLSIEEMRTLREGTLTFSKSYSELHGLVIQRLGESSQKLTMEPAVIAHSMTQFLDKKVLHPDLEFPKLEGLEKQFQAMRDVHRQWIDALSGGKSEPDRQQWRGIAEILSIGAQNKSLEFESILYPIPASDEK